MLSSGESDDQMALCKYIEKYPNKIDIDVDSKIISTVIPFDFHKYKWISQKSRIINTETGEFPCFIHTPGMSADMNIRMDFFGEKILGKKYKSYSFNEKLPLFINKFYYNPALSIKMLLLLIIGLFILFIMYPNIRKYIYVLLIVMVILLIKYKIK
jgi:hypothetical protein